MEYPTKHYIVRFCDDCGICFTSQNDQKTQKSMEYQ